MRHAYAIIAMLVTTAGIAAVEVPDAPICSAPPLQPGTGLSPDGRGLVHVMMGGLYTFHGAVARSTPGPVFLRAGDYAALVAHTSMLQWTRPDGVREVVPKRLLYPIDYFNPPDTK
jgi:hypothetical protein